MNYDEYKIKLLGDQINYFNNLSNDNKKKLFDKMNVSDKKELLNSLDYYSVIDFFNLFSKDEQKEIIKLITPYNLKRIYNFMTDSEQNRFQEIINEMQIDSIEFGNKLISEQSNSEKKINDNQINIVRSVNNIEQQKENKIQKQKELKENIARIKKISREREKKFKKALRQSKVSSLDKIGIINKFRMNRLKKTLEEFQELDIKLNEEKSNKYNIENEINRATNIITQERENIEQYRQEIKIHEELLKENAKEQKKHSIQIKKLNKMGKKIFGRKLFNKHVSDRNCIIINRPNLHVEKQQDTEEILDFELGGEQKEEIKSENDVQQVYEQKGDEQREKIATSPVDVNKIMKYLEQYFEKMSENGINFMPLQTKISDQSNPNLLNESVATVDSNFLISLMYTTMWLQQQLNQRQLTQNETHSKAKGTSSIYILVLIILILIVIGILYLFIR